MYVRLHENIVIELIPDIDPVFPGVPIGERYTPEFTASLLHIPDDTEVEQNWVYDVDSQSFRNPYQE